MYPTSYQTILTYATKERQMRVRLFKDTSRIASRGRIKNNETETISKGGTVENDKKVFGPPKYEATSLSKTALSRACDETSKNHKFMYVQFITQ